MSLTLLLNLRGIKASEKSFTVGLQVVLGDFMVSRVGVTPVFVFRFLEFAKEIDGIDELLLRDFMLILFPMLLHLCVECISSAFTSHSLF
jgi:hypothetical protein